MRPTDSSSPHITQCDRAFLRLPHGLVHYRYLTPLIDAETSPTPCPLWMMHASPSSSRSVEPLALALQRQHPGRRLLAPDTAGFGDSAPLPIDTPTLSDYGRHFFDMLDRLEIERCDLYGFHTGAHIAIEMALLYPERIGRIVVDGLLWLNKTEREQYLTHYAPPLLPDGQGTQIFQALQFIRDQAWFFPHFMRDAAHNLGASALPPAVLHELTIDLLKAAETYHLAYHAVFRHDVGTRLPLLTQPLLLTADRNDPTRSALEPAAACAGSKTVYQQLTDASQGLEPKARLINDFLSS